METETRTEVWGREDDNYLLLLYILLVIMHVHYIAHNNAINIIVDPPWYKV